MSYEPKEGSVTIFKNDKKGNDKWPDYRGEVMIGGKPMEVALWVKEGKNGKFFGGTVKPKQEKKIDPQAPDPFPGDNPW